MAQAVIVHLRLNRNCAGSVALHDALLALQDRIAIAIDESVVGEFDGDLVGQGECILYMYGPDADRLFEAVEPLLKSFALGSSGYAIKRYGDVYDSNAREVRVVWGGPARV
jgi:hypothetical protein